MSRPAIPPLVASPTQPSQFFIAPPIHDSFTTEISPDTQILRKPSLAPAAEISSSFESSGIHASFASTFTSSFATTTTRSSYSVPAVPDPPASDLFDPIDTTPRSLRASISSASDPDEPPSISEDEMKPRKSRVPRMSPRVKVVDVYTSFELEEITGDYEDMLLANSEITVLRPSEIEEYVEPGPSSRNRRCWNSPETDMSNCMRNMSVYDSDSDLEEPEVREFIKRQREIKRQTRLSHGSSIGKRPFSERDDPDIEDLKSRYREGTVFAEASDVGEGERRTRRKVEKWEGGLTMGIPEVDEPNTDDEVLGYDYTLDCELPYHGFEVMEMEMERENDNGVPLYSQETC